MSKTEKTPKIIVFLVGLLTLFIIVFLLGAFSPLGVIMYMTDFLQFVALSIICTAGITLLLWIPGIYILGYITGTLIRAVYYKIYPERLQTTQSTASETKSTRPARKLFEDRPLGDTADNQILAPPPPPPKIELALIAYINDARNTGTMGDEVIRLNLKNSGWSDAFIDSAFKQC